MSLWIDPTPAVLPPGFKDQLGVSAFAAEILFKRGFTSVPAAKAFLYSSCYQPAPPEQLPGIKLASEVILQHIENRKPILVWGDFDVDGQTATTILTSALGKIGGQVKHYIPIRSNESHGINIERLNSLTGNSGLLLTCDTGITAHEAIKFARSKGLATIITDHHDLPSSLPPADGIVSPRFLADNHPLAALPGVAVAFKLVENIYKLKGLSDNISEFLDLTALGIVADVAELIADTRYLLQKGLECLRSTERIGLQALFEQAEINPQTISADHIGFMVAPRLNALGRLGDANIIVEFLTTADRTRARLIAIELEAMNAKRKLLTDQVLEGALAQIDRNPRWEDQSALVLSHPAWPAGVIGIVASRLAEIYHKPVILIAVTDGKGRGSARSIPGVNVTQAIASQSNLLDGFGGHPMAGGLSIEQDNIDSFRSGFIEAVELQEKEIPTTVQLQIDTWVELSQINLEFAREINVLSPFGPGNPPVTLGVKNLHILNHRKIGRYGEHLRITVADTENNHQDIFWWQGSSENLPETAFDLAFTIQPSDYQGKPGIEVTWIESKVRPLLVDLIPQPVKTRTNDCRQTLFPEDELKKFASELDSIIWCEAQSCPGGNCADRLNLEEQKHLIIWTIPPGRHELKQAIQKTKPETITFFASDPYMDSPKVFLQRLAGLIKYDLTHSEGTVSLKGLAAAISQTEITIRTALMWLYARGDLASPDFSEDICILRPGNRQEIPERSQFESHLKILLSETSAFRKYYLHGDLDELLL